MPLTSAEDFEPQIALIFKQLRIKGIVFFRTADYADDADFTLIDFLDAQAQLIDTVFFSR